MNYSDMLNNAKALMMPNCRVCKTCNGVACRGEIPGMGGKGTGESFVRAYEKLAEIKIVMDTIYEPKGRDTKTTLFGKEFAAPIFAAPISGMHNNYNGYFTEKTYAACLVPGMLDGGCAAFTGDGASAAFFDEPLEAVAASGGMAIPTIKPWDQETVFEKIEKAERAGAFAIAMDVDSAGLPLLAAAGKPVEAKSVEELRQIKQKMHVPFIIKGIMSVAGARKAKEAGADGIVVSNHGGRVMDHSLAPIEVLPEIRQAVGDSMVILLDGAIRTGVDVFKALALGANGVLIGRPFVVAAYGGNREGVALYTEKIKKELEDTMKMTGCGTISDIGFQHVDCCY